MLYKKHFDHRLDMLELYLTVRDPGTAKAAEAYDGLRKLLINANKGTQVHVAHLAELHRVASVADSTAPVIAKLNEFMRQVGLHPVSEASHDEFFEVTGGRGSGLVVDSPAYVSLDAGGTVTLVMRGIAHYEDPTSEGAEVSSISEHRPSYEDEMHTSSSEESTVEIEPDDDEAEGA